MAVTYFLMSETSRIGRRRWVRTTPPFRLGEVGARSPPLAPWSSPALEAPHNRRPNVPNDRKPRRHEFLFCPRDYLFDPAVVRMSLQARGAYSTLLFELWDQPEPGVVVSDHGVLAAMARATTDEWDLVKHQVQAAFDADSRPGFWVQKRMVAEHERQDEWVAEMRRRGHLGAEKRWHPLGRAMAPPRQPHGTPIADSQVSQVSQEEESTHLPIFDGQAGPSPSANGKSPKDDWLEAFDQFYSDYPRKVKPDAARRAWLAIKPWSQDRCDQVYRGMVRWREYWSNRETPVDKIPYPASFLNGGQWKEPPG